MPDILVLFLSFLLVIVIGYALLLPTLWAPKEHKAIVFILSVMVYTNPIPFQLFLGFVEFLADATT